MNRTQTRIAKILRKQIGAHYTLICSTPQHQLKDADYWAARSKPAAFAPNSLTQEITL